jgi:hypothetical protein
MNLCAFFPRGAEVAVEIVRFTDDCDEWPRFVEARLIDFAGREWLFHDKAPIFTCEDINSKSVFPKAGIIRCQLVSMRLDSDRREIAIIDTALPDHVETPTGETRFEVSPDNVKLASPAK